MADTPIRKFMFDKSFDGAAGTQRAQDRVPQTVTLKPEQLEALKKEAYDQGFNAGQRGAAEAQAQGVQVLLMRIEGKIADLIQNLDAVEKERENTLRNTVLAIAKKLLPDFTARHGMHEIQAMLADVIAEMVHEPRLVVRTHESEFDAVNTKIHEITVQKAYAGKVVVLADAEIAPGDCRIEWADGGIERKVEATWQNVEQAIAPATPSESSHEETNHG